MNLHAGTERVARKTLVGTMFVDRRHPLGNPNAIARNILPTNIRPPGRSPLNDIPPHPNPGVPILYAGGRNSIEQIM